MSRSRSRGRSPSRAQTSSSASGSTCRPFGRRRPLAPAGAGVARFEGARVRFGVRFGMRGHAVSGDGGRFGKTGDEPVCFQSRYVPGAAGCCHENRRNRNDARRWSGRFHAIETRPDDDEGKVHRRHETVRLLVDRLGGGGSRRELSGTHEGSVAGNDRGDVARSAGAEPPHVRNACAIARAIPAGESGTITPAPRSASSFSRALPRPPAMIAPACPMRRPAGAVVPAT